MAELSCLFLEHRPKADEPNLVCLQAKETEGVCECERRGETTVKSNKRTFIV